MLAAHGPSPGWRAGIIDAVADDALHGLLVVDRVAALADRVEVGEQRVDRRVRLAA